MSTGDTLTFSATLLGWTNESDMLATYVELPADTAKAVATHELHQRILTGKRRGFGSVKVNVTIGASEWSTSLFPQKDGTWFLPVKADVRRGEKLAEGDEVTATLELL
ncbi:DUF1905 domain-containing protein [Aurantiacibacter sp. MUD11]|uniref:DUF1905 domain-containing protein n=1 Tax=Aurantiacibacter sp. MUD11 TaxID=3003265 RepID=UPI0022AAB915|nr:DUF1905 domain-containing protein [Aurantiacibacter sp. MUD11]WAT17705.1 DUF1905 domain-containing protein [Aurantiacibacter sp. MUD11]